MIGSSALGAIAVGDYAVQVPPASPVPVAPSPAQPGAGRLYFPPREPEPVVAPRVFALVVSRLPAVQGRLSAIVQPLVTARAAGEIKSALLEGRATVSGLADADWLWGID